MAEPTPSFFRLSWEMAQVGARLAGDLLSGDRGWERSAVTRLDAIRYDAEQAMSPLGRRLLRLGDQLQRGAVDLVADVAGRALGPLTADGREREK